MKVIPEKISYSLILLIVLLFVLLVLLTPGKAQTQPAEKDCPQFEYMTCRYLNIFDEETGTIYRTGEFFKKVKDFITEHPQAKITWLESQDRSYTRLSAVITY